MEQVEIYGIVFRSHGHAAWFFMSLVAVAVHIAHQLIVPILKPTMPVFYGLIPVLIHLGATVDAFIATHGGRRESAPFTPDCIWFNALMVMVHVFIIIIFRRRKYPARAYVDGP